MKVGELLGRNEQTAVGAKMPTITKQSLEEATASASSSSDEEDRSRVSSLSASTGDDMTSVGEDSDDMERFERNLRQKHAKACKAMAVSRSITRVSTTVPPRCPCGERPH